MDTTDLLLSIMIILLLVGMSFYLGFRIAKNKFIHDTIGNMLGRLEHEGHIRTRMDADGNAELIPISEVVAEALEESRVTRSPE
jgi:hypothetical protein